MIRIIAGGKKHQSWADEAIAEYESNVYFDILAEDLARRDMNDAPIDESNMAELTSRMEVYISEFEKNGTDNITVDMDC